MNIARALMCGGALALSCAAPGRTAQVAPVPTPVSLAPSGRLGEGWWADRHQAVLAAAAAHPDARLLLIGDSITNNYDKANPPDEDFQPTWKTFYAPRGALNLGFSGDTTSNLLWRLDHGEVAGLHPKAVVLLIGTNDTGAGARSAEQTERGIDAVVGDLETRLPETRILLLGVLPSDVSAEKSAKDATVNDYLARSYGQDPRVTYLDIGSILRRSDGALDLALFYDPRLPQHLKALHPDTVGERRMAEAVEPTLARLMDEPPRLPLAAMTEERTAVIPVPSLEQDSYDWWARHNAALALGRRINPRVVMIGDSITHFWGGEPAAFRQGGPNAWRRLFGDAPVLNLGFGWDRTQNVLWRLRDGELEGLAPAWVVINIGTNNLTGTDHARASTPQETAEGVAAIVREVRARSPASRIVLMGVFPRGAHASDPLRGPIADTNRLLAQRFGNVPGVRFLDIGDRFLTTAGDLPPALMPDGTHPSEAGYAIWADALFAAGVRP